MSEFAKRSTVKGPKPRFVASRWTYRNYQNIGQRGNQDKNQQNGDNQNNNWYETRLVSDISSTMIALSVETSSIPSNPITLLVAGQSEPVQKHYSGEKKTKNGRSLKNTGRW